MSTKTRTKPERQLGVALNKAKSSPKRYASWFLLSNAPNTVWWNGSLGMRATWNWAHATLESSTKIAGLQETWSFWRGRGSQFKQREQGANKECDRYLLSDHSLSTQTKNGSGGRERERERERRGFWENKNGSESIVSWPGFSVQCLTPGSQLLEIVYALVFSPEDTYKTTLFWKVLNTSCISPRKSYLRWPFFIFSAENGHRL